MGTDDEGGRGSGGEGNRRVIFPLGSQPFGLSNFNYDTLLSPSFPSFHYPFPFLHRLSFISPSLPFAFFHLPLPSFPCIISRFPFQTLPPLSPPHSSFSFPFLNLFSPLSSPFCFLFYPSISPYIPSPPSTSSSFHCSPSFPSLLFCAEEIKFSSSPCLDFSHNLRSFVIRTISFFLFHRLCSFRGVHIFLVIIIFFISYSLFPGIY